jgi:hypothetical protein
MSRTHTHTRARARHALVGERVAAPQKERERGLTPLIEFERAYFRHAHAQLAMHARTVDAHKRADVG